MTKNVLATLCSLSIVLAASAASAQTFSAQGWINGGISVGGGVQVGMAPPPPPPPPQPMIVVEQPPVYYQPPPRQVVVVQQPPTYTYTTTTTVAYLGTERARGLGLGAYAAGMSFGGRNRTAGVGGVGATVRYRQHPMFATELSIAGMAGTDYNSDSRVEVPVTLSELIYFNPQNRFQFYGVVGFGMSWAAVSYNDANARTRGMDNAAYTYVGGLAGLGVEWQLSPNFSIYSDARAFVRTRIDPGASSNPEFTRTNADGRTETTNVSVGVVGQVGALFYF